MRLKGGDPFVFGRGAEEALALAHAGIPFEVVPGVTTAVAAPELAGIPVTHRGVASGFLVIAGHAGETLDATLAAVQPEQRHARRDDGPGGARAIAARLMAHGWAADDARGASSAARRRRMRGRGPGRGGGRRGRRRRTGVPGVLVVGEVVRVREALAARGRRA